MGHFEPLHAFLGIREQQAARAMQPTGLAGYFFQFVVKADGVALQLGHIRIAVESVKAAGGVPRRSRRELIALDEHHVLPTGFGQVVKDAATDDATTDYGNPCMRFHGAIPSTATS